MITYRFKKGDDTAVNLRQFPYGSSSFPVKVESSTGLIGRPSFKSVGLQDWKYLNGTMPDLSNRTYENKTIELVCWIEGRSKQEMVDRINAFLAYFRYDGFLFMKVTWDTDNDNGGVLPNPHVSRGLYGVVWLDDVTIGERKWRWGMNRTRLTLTFKDPYPLKRVCVMTGTEEGGVDYDIVSETEIDIYSEDGVVVNDILVGSGHLPIAKGAAILICGDVTHATDSQGGDDIITATKAHENTIETIYEEI